MLYFVFRLTDSTIDGGSDVSLRSQSPSYANSTIHRPCATRDECQGCVVCEAIPTRRVSEGTSPAASHHDNHMSLANASGCHAKHFKAGNCSAMEYKMFRKQPLSPVFGLPASNCSTHSSTKPQAMAEECLRSGMVKRPLSPAMLDEPTGMLRSQSLSYANSTIHRP